MLVNSVMVDQLQTGAHVVGQGLMDSVKLAMHLQSVAMVYSLQMKSVTHLSTALIQKSGSTVVAHDHLQRQSGLRATTTHVLVQ